MAEQGIAGQQPAEEPAGFEANLTRLEEIVARLEEGNLGLEESLRLYEDGVRAFRRCQHLLNEADLKVRKLVETVEGELKEEPFGPEPVVEGPFEPPGQ